MKKTSSKKRQVKKTKTNRVSKFPLLTFVTICSFAVLVTFGTWQVKRLLWKNELINKVEANITQPTTNIPSNSEIEGYEFRRLRVTGEFLNVNEIHLGARYYKKKLGYHIYTPFRLDDGRIFLVNRGWVPADKKERDKRPGSLITERVTLNVLLLKPQRNKGWFLPANNPQTNLWLTVDMAEMAASTKLKLEPYILQEIGSGNDKTPPIAVQPKPEIRNDHLQYAFTWYALAIALVVIYFIFTRKPK